MTDRIIFTAIPSRPDVARVCADECRIKLTDLSTATLRTDQITVRSMYKMLSKNAQRDTGRISFDTFHALMDDVFRNNARSSGGGKTYQFRRVVQKLYRAADSDSKMSLTPVELMCGLSLLCRPEAGISGVDIDSTTPIVEDVLRILCPDGNVTYERLNAYFTILFSILSACLPIWSRCVRSDIVSITLISTHTKISPTQAHHHRKERRIMDNTQENFQNDSATKRFVKL